ncbi:hypothetical protein BDN72DRAFT_834657 [Pluteus cervinus]|uniref:Uncharacterized protein n=1 Tax=Pluteus cervinus TaxID=181527 RepID=A0ACD3B6T2_9AGAR|nr:hypothetical protein BDN72DRAFT_834657 [Pluteus cervinus]
MATLTRPKSVPTPATSSLLDSVVPEPFPRELLAQENIFADPSGLGNTQVAVHQELEAGPSRTEESEMQGDTRSNGAVNELMPSIASVQRSCLMTLNNLLSAPTRWSPIVPDRRHSLPPNPLDSSTQKDAELSSSSALMTLLSNLRNRDSTEGMIELHSSPSESELIHELRTRVQRISSTFEPVDAQLALALVSLLSHFNRLAIILSASKVPLAKTDEPETRRSNDLGSTLDHFDTLKRHLSDFQLEKLSSQPESLAPGAPPVVVVETALLWSRIDEELETVVSMCKERAENLPRFSADHLPPHYDDPEAYHYDMPPEYDAYGQTAYDDDKKTHTLHANHSSITLTAPLNEKMRLDLEAVSMAIDRLYIVAPQLHNQRVELKSSKVAEMERARQEGQNITLSREKQKEREVEELDSLLDKLGRASNRTFNDQTFTLDGGMQARLESARRRDTAKRDAFVEQLANHSDAGRFHAQDATFQPPRTKDPEALLSLPEFIREAIPLEAQRLEDPLALLTLPEFFREPPPTHVLVQKEEVEVKSTSKSKKSRRDRSLSAPPLAWLRSSASRNSLSQHARTKSKGSTSGFDVSYVAENHENLQHILAFMTVTGATPGVDIEAEVLPPFPEPHTEGGDRLLLKCGTQTSLPLCLPGRTTPGKKEVKVQSGHFEIKLPVIASETSAPTAMGVAGAGEDTHAPLLDASQLIQARPTSFICASCSLPLVQSSQIGSYRDLPSEHWEELVDAWMCHSDQKLHDQVSQHGRTGFWPQPGLALVGGSYILFDHSSMIGHNLSHADQAKRGDGWRIVRCLCGAVIGRCQAPSAIDESNGSGTAYRLLKYTVRPVSPTSEPVKIPLSAFIVEDMLEFVRAHATYRFVILDEEEERARMLIWLFKPNMRLAYTTPIPYAIPKSGSVHAAKVLYKVLSSSEGIPDLKSLLNRYPGFPQAEYMYYPLAACARLAGLLKESTTAYPESLRTMTGLDVGWLIRA